MSNFWNPANIAHRAEQAQQQIAQQQAAQEQAQHAEFLNVVGQTLINIINSRAVQGGADTEVVAGEFFRAFPQAGPGDYRRTLETLKQEGLIYELKSVEGLMGSRTSRLYALPAGR